MSATLDSDSQQGYNGNMEEYQGKKISIIEDNRPINNSLGIDKGYDSLTSEEDLSSTSNCTDPVTDVDYMSSSEECLKKKLQDLRCDLSAEQAIRRKSDKCLVKLAKQLKKRTDESEAKERQIYKMAKTINDLEDLLHNHHHELAEDQEKIRNICRETEARLEDYEALVLSLRKQLFDSNVEVESLRLQLEQRRSSNPRSYHSLESIMEHVSISIDTQSTRLLGAVIAATAVVCFSVLFNHANDRDSTYRYRGYR